jgi:NAD(P)-dependent dehydrogenase (short-subunit alcohol dehydrogenase family)
MRSMERPFWDQSPAQWRAMMGAGPQAYFLMSVYAARLMAARKGGLIVSVTDGYVKDAADTGAMKGQLVWNLAHASINRLMRGMAAEAKAHRIAVVTLMPGFMRTEGVVRDIGHDEKLKKTFRFDLSETPEFLGRGVAALAADAKVMRKTGKVWLVADLAEEYGFADVDGKVPRFVLGA